MTETTSNITYAIGIVLFFYIISRMVDVILNKVSKKYDTSTSEVFRLLSNSQHVLFITIGLILAIDRLGFDISALVAGLGLSGFALGFALKDAISNLVAGMMIVIYKPFEIGDTIQISSNQGIVLDINLRYITLKSETGTCLVPNSLFLNSVLNLYRQAADK